MANYFQSHTPVPPPYFQQSNSQGIQSQYTTPDPSIPFPLSDSRGTDPESTSRPAAAPSSHPATATSSDLPGDELPGDEFADNNTTDGLATTPHRAVDKFIATPQTASGNASQSWLKDSSLTSRSWRKSHIEAYRDEIEERTKNGESCEQIAEALIAKGVQTSSKSVARLRIRWGYRKRAVRKQKVNPNKQPKTVAPSALRLEQLQHREEIAHMVNQGLSPKEITQILATRGLKFVKGVATVRRLITTWKIGPPDPERQAQNVRYLATKKARIKQRREFESYARDLGVEEPESWVNRKVNEPAARKARRDLAFSMMREAAQGDASQTPIVGNVRVEPFPREIGRQEETPGTLNEEGGITGAGSGEELENTESTRTLRSAGHHRTSEYPVEEFDGDASDSYSDGEYDRNYPTMMEPTDENDFGQDTAIEAGSNHHSASIPDTIPSSVSAGHISQEESEKIASMSDLAKSLIAGVQRTKELLDARLQGRPARESLTGLPPSSEDIQAARHRLKEAAMIVLDAL